MGDRIAVLKDGLLQQVGTPQDLYDTPANVFVAGFIGSPGDEHHRSARRSRAASAWATSRSPSRAPPPRSGRTRTHQRRSWACAPRTCASPTPRPPGPSRSNSSKASAPTPTSTPRSSSPAAAPSKSWSAPTAAPTPPADHARPRGRPPPHPRLRPRNRRTPRSTDRDRDQPPPRSPMPLRATATAAEPDLLFLPWGTALEQWPAEDTVAMPRGISRHIVRFVRVNGAVFAVKEIEESFAHREYALLFDLPPARRPVRRAGRGHRRAGRRRRRGPSRRAGHPTPVVLAALPGPGQAHAQPRHVGTAARRPRAAHRATAPARVRLERLLPVQHALPARRGGVRGLPRRRRDRGAARVALATASAAYDMDTAAMNVMGELMDLQAGGLVPDDARPRRGRRQTSSGATSTCG